MEESKLDKIINGLDYCKEREGSCISCPGNMECWCDEAIKLLEKQKQIKTPDEFKSLLLGMFDSIWDVEIDHPVFQDKVGELMEGVLQAYSEAVKWE